MCRSSCERHIFYELVQNDRCTPGDLGIEPGDIAGGHIDAAVTTTAVEGSGAAGIDVREIVIFAEVGSPPGIVEEVAVGMVLHRVLDGCRWIPEDRTGRLARFELRGTLTQDDAPEAGR